MNKRSFVKIPRKGWVLAFLIVGLVALGSVRSRGVQATTCYEAFEDYYTADNAYDNARVLWFYNSPTTCQYDCRNETPGPDFDQCVAECQITRQTTLAAASVDLFAKALQTCEPVTVDECDQARAMAEGCYSQYPYLDYQDLDERLALYQQYSACRLASKIDSCQ